MTLRSGVGSKTSTTALQMSRANSSSVPVKRLGAVLVVDGRLGDGGLGGLAEAGALEGDVDDALLVGAEHDVALQDAGGVVEVDDRLLGALDRLVGAVDEVLARLGQHLDGDVVGDRVLVDEAAHEVEVGLRGRGEADLDLLVAHVRRAGRT